MVGRGIVQSGNLKDDVAKHILAPTTSIDDLSALICTPWNALWDDLSKNASELVRFFPKLVVFSKNLEKPKARISDMCVQKRRYFVIKIACFRIPENFGV